MRFAVLWFCMTPVFAQGVITTVAGTDWLFPGDGRPALNAPLSGAEGMGIAVDGNGSYYIADVGNYMVMRVGPDKIVNVIAGNGVNFVSGDGGRGVNAAVPLPTAVAVDAAGNVFIAEYGSRVRELTPDGNINTFAGTGAAGFAGDGGSATQALLNAPHGLAVDTAGDVYISDTNNNRVRKVTPDGRIVTVAGNGQRGNSGDNLPATSVPLNLPTRIAVDSSGNLYIVEFSSPDLTQGNRVRKVDSKGNISTIAADAFLLAVGVAVDASGNVYILDAVSQGVIKVDSLGGRTTIAGGSYVPGFAGDGGPAGGALFNFSLYPDVAVDSSGNIFIADDGNNRVREISPAGSIQTIAGDGLFLYSGNGGPATGATLDYPVGVIGDNSGNLYVTEALSSRVRRIAPDGTISVYAGKGGFGSSGDNGPAVSAALRLPMYMTFAPDGSLLVADSSNCVIRSIDAYGIIHTLAGNGNCSYGGDGGPALKASFGGPSGMAFDSAGDLVIADTYNNRLREIFANGNVATLAGDGKAAFSGDGGSASKAEVNQPVGVRIYNGAIYFSDYGNHRIRKIDLNTLTITTVAGNGNRGLSGDGGPATAASLNFPEGITFDAAGNLYIADAGNSRVRKVDPTGIISTFAGSKSQVAGDGGLATNAGLGAPLDVWVDTAGNVLITDAAFGRVRSVLATPPSFEVSTANLAVTATAGGTPVDQSVNVTGSIPGIPFTITTTADGPWLKVLPLTTLTPATMPASLKITADPSMLSPGSYTGTITINAPNARPSQLVVQVALTVAAAGQPSLNVKPLSLTFSFVRGATAATRAVTVSNAGGGSLTFETGQSSPWLRATPGAGTLGAFGITPVSITADPTGLAPGTYSGTAVFSSVSPAQSVVVPVIMTVTAVQQTILIPQSGLTFYAVEGGGALLPQFFSILNTGVGLMQFTTGVSTLSGDSWLSVFPSGGSSDASSPVVPQIRVDVTPGNLAAGIYYGTVQVTAPQADNNPQFVSVVLNVLPAGSKIGPLVQPTGLIYTAVLGGESPGSQEISLQSTDSNPAGFSSAFAAADSASWLTPLPAGGNISPALPSRIVLQPQTAGLTRGVHRGTVTLSFSDGSTRTVSIVLVVVPAGAAPSSSARRPADQTTCVPTTLAPVFTQLSSGFTVAAGFPGQVAVKVVDDCGVSMTGGSVTVSFSNGDAPLRLISLKDGNWAATWTPQHSISPITVTADAAIPEQNLAGQARIVGGLGAGTTLTVGAGGILNGASYAPQGPIAPGSYVAIFGSQLAQGQTSAGSVPLPTSLGGSSVVLAGLPTPLVFASDGQVNAIVPYGIAVNTSQQLIVSRGNSLSVPQAITVAAAAPGIYSRDGSGQGQGIILGVDSSGAQIFADSSHPVHAGDTVVIYCTGLGEVNPPVVAGTLAPLATLSHTVNQVSVMIGGVAANVAFAGLTPGSAGLYQVNATIPPGVIAGDQVPVVLEAAGQQSQPVTIAVR